MLCGLHYNFILLNCECFPERPKTLPCHSPRGPHHRLGQPGLSQPRGDNTEVPSTQHIRCPSHHFLALWGARTSLGTHGQQAAWSRRVVRRDRGNPPATKSSLQVVKWTSHPGYRSLPATATVTHILEPSKCFLLTQTVHPPLLHGV